MGDSSATGNLIEVMTGIKSSNGEVPENVSECHTRYQVGFILSMKRADRVVAVVKGKTRPSKETDDADTGDAIMGGGLSPAPLLTPEPLDTA